MFVGNLMPVLGWNETEKWAQLSALLKPGYWLLRLILTYDRIFVLLTYFYIDSCEIIKCLLVCWLVILFFIVNNA